MFSCMYTEVVLDSKKIGVPRFSGKGLAKFDPRPGTVQWYKANMPERFNNTKINIRSGLGCSDQEAERIAAQVLRRIEAPIQGIIDSGALDKERCPSCAFHLKHTDKPFPKWDKKA